MTCGRMFSLRIRLKTLLTVVITTNLLLLITVFLFYSDSLSAPSKNDLHAGHERKRNVRTLLQDEVGAGAGVVIHKETVYSVPLNKSVLPRAKFESRSRSVVFLKTFKVGGTTISSLLSAYAFNTHQKLEKIDSYCKGKSFIKAGHCVDLIGTDHPKALPCNYPKIQSESFCNQADVFMMIREPIDRLWSGYKHEVKIAGSVFPLSRFLASKTIVKTPSHHLLAKNVKTALRRTSDIHILLHHLYDQSLVYMALQTGMKLCDIMYVPCDQASWGATKCNTKTNVTMSDQDRRDMMEVARETGEQEFYSTLVSEAEARLQSSEVVDLTAKYRLLRSRSLQKCLQPGVVSSIEQLLKNHPYVKRDKGKEFLWHYQVEMSNPLDPLTICLGWYCHES